MAVKETPAQEEVIFRSTSFGYTATLRMERRMINQQTGGVDVFNEPGKPLVAKFTEDGQGSEYRTSDPDDIARLRQLAHRDPYLYEWKPGQAKRTPTRKPGQTHRGEVMLER